MSARSTLDMLGDALRDLAPLVAAAVQALNKPGTRGLRRKLDSEFNVAVGHYGTLMRLGAPESQWDALRLPRYERATEVWPGHVAFEARMAREAAAREQAAQQGTHGLRLVIDNAAARRSVNAPALGGAA